MPVPPSPSLSPSIPRQRQWCNYACINYCQDEDNFISSPLFLGYNLLLYPLATNVAVLAGEGGGGKLEEGRRGAGIEISPHIIPQECILTSH